MNLLLAALLPEGILYSELTDASQTESEISIYLEEKNIAPAFEQMQDIVKETITAYNAQRPHGSLDFLTPLQAHEQTGILKKRWKNYKKKQAPN